MFLRWELNFRLSCLSYVAVLGSVHVSGFTTFLTQDSGYYKTVFTKGWIPFCETGFSVMVQVLSDMQVEQWS